MSLYYENRAVLSGNLTRCYYVRFVEALRGPCTVYISCTVEDSPPFETPVDPRTACGATRKRDRTQVRRSEEVQQAQIHRGTCRTALAACRTAAVINNLCITLSQSPNYRTTICAEVNNAERTRRRICVCCSRNILSVITDYDLYRNVSVFDAITCVYCSHKILPVIIDYDLHRNVSIFSAIIRKNANSSFVSYYFTFF